MGYKLSMGPHLDADPRRDRILQAALVLCLERSPEAVTIQQIRGLSGASTGSIYHHFRDKQGLFFELFLTAKRTYHDALVDALGPTDHARSLVFALARAHLDWMMENSGLARFLHTARRSELVRGDEPDLREQDAAFVHDVCAYLRPWVDAGQVRRLPDDLAMAVVIGPMEHYTSEWLMGRTFTDPDEACEVLAEAAWDALRAIPAA